MYANFYGLSSEPFRLTPSGRACYEHKTFQRAKSYLLYALSQREGILVLTAPPGMGKSSLVSEFLRESVGSRILVAEIISSRLGADDLLGLVAARFDVPPEGLSKSALLSRLEQRLRDVHENGRRAVLIIDEAQGLSADALEEIRGLTNLNADGKPLLQIFLVGQPALRTLVDSPGLEQLHQRIIATCRLDPLDEAETKAYVEHCLREADWQGNPKLKDVIYPLLYSESLGVPRRINLICTRLLLRGLVERTSSLGLSDLTSALDDLRQEGLLPSSDGTKVARENQ